MAEAIHTEVMAEVKIMAEVKVGASAVQPALAVMVDTLGWALA